MIKVQYNHQTNMSVKCIPPLTHFYIAKLGYAGVYLFGEAVLTSTHNLCFGAKIRKTSFFFSGEIFDFCNPKKFLYITWACFRNGSGVSGISTQAPTQKIKMENNLNDNITYY